MQLKLGSAPVERRGRASVRFLAVLLLMALVVVACGGEPVADVSQTTRSHNTATNCDGGFVIHELDHVTIGRGSTITTFDATGTGVGVADLDKDDDLDIVLANLTGSPAILTNEGGLEFSRSELELGRFRGVSLVDVDGDEYTDIVLTTGIGPPVFYKNPADGTVQGFERTQLVNVRAATYSMAWTDLGGDGDLDVVTGSYNAELTQLRNSPILGEDTGVVLHEASADGFVVTRLSDTAQALALVTTDVDGDDRQDILVGNDLGTPDMLWIDEDSGWTQQIDPFDTSSYSTMSFDAADIDNDGRNELFSTDMAPRVPGDDRYRNVFDDLAAAPEVDDIQTPENVLNDPNDGMTFENLAEAQAISTTGWSWSGIFGDLDNDGFQDLYVANGMQSQNLFGFLPDGRLIEENQAFANRDGQFVTAQEWGLNVDDDGRGMSMADIDADGDLDIIVNNLGSPAQLFENRNCGQSVTVELSWPGTLNQSALGATVRASANGNEWQREITSSRGYLSSGPPIAHIGVGNADSVDLEVTWPDGFVSRVEQVAVESHVIVSREQQ